MRRRQQEYVVSVALPAPKAHNLAIAAERGQRKSIGQRLTECREIGLHTVCLLRTPVVPAKTCDHFVEYKNGSVFSTLFAHALGNPA